MTQPSEKLFDEVLADGRTKADRVLKRGQRDAKAAGEKAAKEAEVTAQRIRDAAKAEGETRRAQIMATLEIEAQRERLARLEESLGRVYELANASLASADSQARRDAMLALAVDALRQMPDREVTIALPPKEHESDGAAFAEELAGRAASALGHAVQVRADDRPGPVRDGVVIRSADRRREAIQSLGERLRRVWPQLRLQAAQRLFPSEVTRADQGGSSTEEDRERGSHAG